MKKKEILTKTIIDRLELDLLCLQCHIDNWSNIHLDVIFSIFHYKDNLIQNNFSSYLLILVTKINILSTRSRKEYYADM